MRSGRSDPGIRGRIRGAAPIGETAKARQVQYLASAPTCPLFRPVSSWAILTPTVLREAVTFYLVTVVGHGDRRLVPALVHWSTQLPPRYW